MNIRAAFVPILCLAFSCALAAYVFYLRPLMDAAAAVTGQVVPRTEAPLPAPVAHSDEPIEELVTSFPPLATPTPMPQMAPSMASFSGSRRVNILLLGSDTDAKFKGAYNSQIMIVVSIDPAAKQVSMLSLPRDFWVPIPGAGMGKLGSALMIGGVALTRDAIERDFGIPIDYYAWVGLDGFVKVIDLFGGVDLDVSHPIVDDSYPDDLGTADPYASRRLYIPAGPQHLEGTRALEYVRTRHGDMIGDFGRSRRQQQLLDALRSKVDGQALIPRLPQLAADLKDSLRTDMTLLELAKLAAFADDVKPSAVQRYTLSPPRYARTGWSTDGQSVVIPDWPAVRLLVDQVFQLRTSFTSGLSGPSAGARLASEHRGQP